MPNVNGKEFPYTPEGMKRALAAKKAQKKMPAMGEDKKMPAMGQKSKMNPARPKKAMGY